MPKVDIKEAFSLLLENKPTIELESINRFIQYFQHTWLSLFPLNLWNHYDTNGPRTNNHVEGENAALNRFVNVDSPDSLIVYKRYRITRCHQICKKSTN